MLRNDRRADWCYEVCFLRCENRAERGNVVETTMTSEKRFAAEENMLQ